MEKFNITKKTYDVYDCKTCGTGKTVMVKSPFGEIAVCAKCAASEKTPVPAPVKVNPPTTPEPKQPDPEQKGAAPQ